MLWRMRQSGSYERMQVFDQQITAVALCRRHTDEGTDLGHCSLSRLTALELRARLTQLLAKLV